MLNRREFLVVCGAGGSMLLVDGCGGYAPESGPGYAPWRFPAASYPDPRLELVHAAILAANPHNTQPWRFKVDAAGISLFADRSRRLGDMDPIERELMVGLGCALENLLVAARQHGQRPQLTLLPDPADPTHVARVALPGGGPAVDPCYAVLAKRCTNRGAYADRALPQAQLAQLSALAQDAPGRQLRWLTSAADKARFAQMTLEATRAIVADLGMSRASYRWYRHTRAEIDTHRDGLTLDAQALGGLTTAAAKLLPRPSRERSDDYWIGSTRDRQCKAVAAFGLLSSERLDDPAQQLAVGRAYQRLHLQATRLGLGMQPLNQAAERRDREHQQSLTPVFGKKLATFVGPDRHAQMLFRIGYPQVSVHHSPRRSLQAVVA